uniref:Uncharacterized protein n=1 Tax=Tetranychus urticae TaxID=32264 RepID=T1JQS4_TETUR
MAKINSNCRSTHEVALFEPTFNYWIIIRLKNSMKTRKYNNPGPGIPNAVGNVVDFFSFLLLLKKRRTKKTELNDDNC